MDIVFFDGVCNLCNNSVQFIIEHDPRKQFHFASLQSLTGREFLERHNLSGRPLDTVYLVQNERVFSRSNAALRIVAKLSWPWPLLRFLAFIPRPLRDFVYNGVARNRYRLFGKRDVCLLPSPALVDRFLN